jgi:hypothetical protein
MKPEWAKRRADPYMIDLTDEQLGSVTLYVQWLYTGDLHAQVHLEKGAFIKTRAEENERMSEILVKAFILGDKLIDKDFQTVILQKWIDTHIISGWTCGPEILTLLYSKTSLGSPARRLVALFVAYSVYDDPSWHSEIEGYPRELLVDVIKEICKLRKRPVEYPWKKSGLACLDTNAE